MADYRNLLLRAIKAGTQNNGIARREVYERARSALVAQLRAIDPPLVAREITRHRLQLEDCIREVEQAETGVLLSNLLRQEEVDVVADPVADLISAQLEAESREIEIRKLEVLIGDAIAVDDLIADVPTKEILENSEAVRQIPAAYGFRVDEGKLFAYPQTGQPLDTSVSVGMAAELLLKAKEHEEKTLAHRNSPDRLKRNASALKEVLDGWAEAPNPGVLLMRFRSIEADLVAFDTADGRAELHDDAVAAMIDLKRSLEDFLALYPIVSKIQANMLALDLQRQDIPKIDQHLIEIEQSARQSGVVDQSTTKALSEGKETFDLDTEVIETSADFDKVALATENRALTTAHRVLGMRNFSAAVIRAGQEGLIEGTKEGIKGVTSGSIKTGFAFLVSTVVGPIGAIAVFVSSLRPVADKVKQIDDDEPEDKGSEKQPE